MAKANLLPTLGEGFKLIFREPLSVLTWGLVSLAAALIPTAVYFALMGGDMIEYYRELFRAAENSAEMPQPPVSGLAGVVQLLQWIAALVSGAVIYSAVYRAILRPEERGVARMRLGMDELYVGLVMVVLFVLLMVVLVVGTIVLVLPIGIGVAVAGAGAGEGAAVIMAFVLVIAALLGIAVLYSRFGMALPMTFAERRIRIFEAWRFTKGYAGQLLAMAVLQILILFALYLAAILVVIAAAAGSFMALGPDGLRQLSSGPELWQRFSGAIIVGLMVYAVMFFILTPILLAPWARAYQRIAADRLEGSSALFS